MITIFLSYRRDDTLETTAHLFRSLQRHYTKDQIFFDLCRESPGATLPDKLAEYVSGSEALIAVIGRDWQQRLGSEWDAVRYELEIALAAKVPIYPVFVQGAGMPAPHLLPDSIRELSHREGLILTALDFDTDIDRLIAAIEAERSRKKQEVLLSAKMEAAALGSKYTEAIQIAGSLIQLTHDRAAIGRRLMQLQSERQNRLDETSVAVTECDRELAAGRIESAIALCETALAVLPDEPDYLRLRARLQSAKDQVRENHQLELIESAARAAKDGSLPQFAAFALKAIEAGASSRPELQKLLHVERFRLRRALLRNPGDATLREMYLAARDKKSKRRDDLRERVIWASFAILLFYGLWAISTVVALHWFGPPRVGHDPAADENPLQSGLIICIARATIPMFAALWILSVVIIRRRRGDDVDTSAAEVRGFGCLLAFGIPTGLIILLKSGLDFLLIPIYGFSAAWLIKQCAVESFSHEGPRPIWRPFNRHRS